LFGPNAKRRTPSVFVASQ